MKGFSILTLIVFLISLSAAIPVPGSKDGDGDKPSRDKGKSRAIDPPSRSGTPPPDDRGPSSRPSTPPPELDHPPLPGRSGVHTEPNNNVVTMHYGDDDLPEHMGHLQRNQDQFPHNRDPLPLSDVNDKNRQHALHNIPTADPHPVTGKARVRDEKLPNMLRNPKHDTSTTVEYLPDHESRKEGGYLSTFQSAIEKKGPNGKGQLRPNPGWVPLHPDQRRGHEAPARLNTQVTKSPGPSGTSGGSRKKATQDPEEKKRKEAELKKAKEAGYTPDPVGPSGITLRHRKGVPQPPPPAPPREKKQPNGPSNLRPGRVAPAGHVWKPSTEGSKASHFGAPGHLQGAEQRYPPRPQNQEHHEKQLKQKDTEAKKKDASPQSHKTPSKDNSKYLPKQTKNLEKFEKEFGSAKKGNGARGSHEAPARMQTHANPSRPSSPRPPSRPATPQQPSRPSSPRPPSRPASPQPPSRPSSPRPPSRPATPQQPSRPSSPRPPLRPPSRQVPSRPNPARAAKPKAGSSSKQAPDPKGGRRRG